MIIAFIFFLLICDDVIGNNYCQFNIENLTNPPLFLEKFGHSHRMSTIESGILNIKRGRSVIATCGSSEFLPFKSGKQIVKTSNLIVMCRMDKSFDFPKNIIIEHNGKQFEFAEVKDFFSCQRSVIQFYNYGVKGCDETGILAGFTHYFGSIPSTNSNITNLVKLVEYCYDETEMRTIFAHHIVAARSPFIENQKQYNTGEVILNEVEPERIAELYARNIDYLYSPVRLRKHFELLLGSAYNNIALSKINLVRDDELPVQFKQATDGYLNTAVQWTGLKDGNWNKLKDDIKGIVSNDIASIYTGTSGVIGLQDSCNRLQHLFINTEQMFEASIPVPLYYWSLIKTKPVISTNQTHYLDGDDGGVVVVSINNPYLKVTELKSYIFCSDICDYIPWLNKLRVTRKMPALGYTFCCHVNEAMEFIPEIPRHCVERINTDDQLESINKPTPTGNVIKQQSLKPHSLSDDEIYHPSTPTPLQIISNNKMTRRSNIREITTGKTNCNCEIDDFELDE